MDIRQLETVLKVNQYSSFSKAAEALNFTQSAVSKQVNALENELGFIIFERGPRKQTVKPTENGEKLLAMIGKMMGSYDDIEKFIADINNEKMKHLRMATGKAFGDFGDIALISSFLKEHKDCEFHHQIGGSTEITDQLKNRELDCFVLAVSATTLWPIPEFNSYITQYDACAIPIYTGKVSVGFSVNHRLSKLEKVHFRDLDGETILVKSNSSRRSFVKDKYTDIVRYCKDSGAHVKLHYFEDPSERLRPMLASMGEGVMINSSNVFMQYKDLIWREIEDYPYPITGYFVYLKDNTNPLLHEMAILAREQSKARGFETTDIRNDD